MSRKGKLAKKQDKIKKTTEALSYSLPFIGEVINAGIEIAKIWSEDEAD